MFRQGKPRAFIHNLRLAAMLSFVAGIVNINGVLAIHTLTTNVTGHFAFFSDHFIQKDYSTAFLYLVYIFSFLAGAFLSGFLIESVVRKHPSISHAAPMCIEIAILMAIAFSENHLLIAPTWIACSLLFAMGLQNALVTKVSSATVRTTHLTGLFTDLGIELSQLFFYRQPDDAKKLRRSISLRLAIITFFFFGGMIGGFLFMRFSLRALVLAAVSLGIALVYERIRYTFSVYRRKRDKRH